MSTYLGIATPKRAVGLLLFVIMTRGMPRTLSMLWMEKPLTVESLECSWPNIRDPCCHHLEIGVLIRAGVEDLTLAQDQDLIAVEDLGAGPGVHLEGTADHHLEREIEEIPDVAAGVERGAKRRTEREVEEKIGAMRKVKQKMTRTI